MWSQVRSMLKGKGGWLAGLWCWHQILQDMQIRHSQALVSDREGSSGVVARSTAAAANGQLCPQVSLDGDVRMGWSGHQHEDRVPGQLSRVWGRRDALWMSIGCTHADYAIPLQAQLEQRSSGRLGECLPAKYSTPPTEQDSFCGPGSRFPACTRGCSISCRRSDIAA